MRTCAQGHYGCLYIGDAPHERSPTTRVPITDEMVERAYAVQDEPEWCLTPPDGIGWDCMRAALEAALKF